VLLRPEGRRRAAETLVLYNIFFYNTSAVGCVRRRRCRCFHPPPPATPPAASLPRQLFGERTLSDYNIQKMAGNGWPFAAGRWTITGTFNIHPSARGGGEAARIDGGEFTLYGPWGPPRYGPPAGGGEGGGGGGRGRSRSRSPPDGGEAKGKGPAGAKGKGKGPAVAKRRGRPPMPFVAPLVPPGPPPRLGRPPKGKGKGKQIVEVEPVEVEPVEVDLFAAPTPPEVVPQTPPPPDDLFAAPTPPRRNPDDYL
jgi:hypothetical protein